MRVRVTAGLAVLIAAGSAGLAEAGCTRSVVNRTPYLVTVGQDGEPQRPVAPHRQRAIRYERSGSVAVAVYCPTGAGTVADLATRPIFQARYATIAVLDRCFVAIGRGGTQPLALNDPRQGDIVVAPYGVSCPRPPQAPTLSARY